MTQSHANCTGNTGKQRGAEAGVNRFTKTMNGCKTQAAKESQTSQTFPLTKTAAAFILPRLPVVTRVHKQWIVFFFLLFTFFSPSSLLSACRAHSSCDRQRADPGWR